MDIICFGFAEWDNPYKTNQHHIMERLSRQENKRILFIESLGLRRPTFQRKDIRRIFNRFLKWLRGIRHINKNLYILSPLVLPFHRYSLIRKINKFLLNVQIDNAIAKLKFTSPILWTYIPNIVEFIGKWNESLLVYHCVDELSANPLIPKEIIKKAEYQLLQCADVVLVSSEPLYHARKNLAKDIRYLPNVADYEHFAKADLAETPSSELLSKIPRPIAGFIGAISRYKLNFELIKIVAQYLPEVSFVFIGPLGEGEKEADISDFHNLKNIYFFGGKSYNILPSILKCFDVCLLPNIQNEYTRNMFPMKFFEYLSAGKPVVATYLESLKDFYDEEKSQCYFANTPEEFAKKVKYAISHNDPIKKNIRQSLARKYTWDMRIEEINKILEEKIFTKNQQLSLKK